MHLYAASQPHFQPDGPLSRSRQHMPPTESQLCWVQPSGRVLSHSQGWRVGACSTPGHEKVKTLESLIFGEKYAKK